MLKINRQNLKDSHETPWLVLDLVMLGILFINLLWLIFDSLYGTAVFQSGLEWLLPGSVAAYAPVHDNFLLIDLSFVGIFLTEFIVRWGVAIHRREYMRWYFYPFARWYDLLGCIPLGSTRIFRFLRIFSILYRLHKYEIINLNDTALFRFLAFYYDALVEELSDRIVIKVLSDAQKEIADGSPLIDEISEQVIATRKPILSKWASSMLTHIGNTIADDMQGEVVRSHVKQAVGKAVRENAQVSTLGLVPVLGSTIGRQLETAVTDIVTHSVINLLRDITPEKVEEFVAQGITDFSSDDHNLDQEALLVVNECIELLKKHVGQQKWKQRLEEKDNQFGPPPELDPDIQQELVRSRMAETAENTEQ
ncbi:hypothetical protein [Aestuariibacter salexigens]|uniref:hypothetical protein n=1 Tax=Aestuariibacter salexigens TaxID=226010 RepID=UPI00040A8D1E|nr:hypothetical protein [Aestuariibacter salexigens]